ncbi:MAG: hypothetical protein ACFB0B_02315 [Thermonemataceae bacterium]
MIISKEKVLDSTLHLTKQVGWDDVSIRNVAKHIRYSTIKAIQGKKSVCQVLFDVFAEINPNEPQIVFIQFFAMLEGFVKISKALPLQHNTLMESYTDEIVKNFLYGTK